MPYQVGEAVKSRATKCPYDFECLGHDKWKTCTIDKEVSGGLFVKNICIQKFCNYFLYFGSHHICICPIRVEIYRRYRI